MATTAFLVFEPLAPGDVVATLAEAELDDDDVLDDEEEIPGADVEEVADDLVLTSPARSAFWDHQNVRLRVEKQQLSALGALKTGLTNIDTRIGGIGLPANISVTTHTSEADAALLKRLVEAAEKQAANTEPPRETCADREDMSNLAFTVVARMNTLATHLMDRQDVSFETVIEKLLDAGTVVLIDEIEALLAVDDDAAESALELLHRALDLETFRKNAPNDLFGELNRRAALLLAAKCAASGVEGPADDWPAPPDTQPLASAPQTTRRRAPKA